MHRGLSRSRSQQLSDRGELRVGRARGDAAEWNSNEEYVVRLTELLVGLAEHQIAQKGHVYATFDIPANIDIAVGPTHMRLAQKYPVIPRRVLRGLLLRP